MTEVDVVVLDDDSGIVSDWDSSSSISDSQLTLALGPVGRRIDDDATAVDADAAALAEGFRVDVARRIGRVVDDFEPVSRNWPLPAKVTPVNSQCAPSPLRILMG